MADETYLAHSGIKNMKWGVRRWQNEDGTYTAAGKLRYFGPKKNTRKSPAKSSKSSEKKNASSQTKKSPARVEQADRLKPVSEMTDQEIKDFLTRRDLEAKYLAAVTPKQEAKAESLTHKYMVQFGTKLADKIVQDAATKIGARIVDSLLGTDKSNNSESEDKQKKKDDNKSSKPQKQTSIPVLDKASAREKELANQKTAYELSRQKQADREADRAAAYELSRQKRADREADRAAAQQRRDERAAAWREREARYEAEREAWYQDALREKEERNRRKNIILFPSGR